MHSNTILKRKNTLIFLKIKFYCINCYYDYKKRNKFLGTSHEKHLSAPKNNLEHTYTHKSLLSTYIIHNYIIYRSVSLCPTF